MVKKKTKSEKKISKVMREYKSGALHSGSKKGPVVKNPKQALAIALSEAKMSRARGDKPKSSKSSKSSRRK